MNTIDGEGLPSKFKDIAESLSKKFIDGFQNRTWNEAIDAAIEVVKQEKYNRPLSKSVTDILFSPYTKIISKLNQLKKP